MNVRSDLDLPMFFEAAHSALGAKLRESVRGDDAALTKRDDAACLAP